MIKIALLTGFLGAGKTTLLQEILTSFGDYKVGVIVNEFGEVNVDARLIEDSGGEGIRMAELSNGSIFCACIKDKFVDSLIEMSLKDINYLFIEASGLADPANMGQILEGIKRKTLNQYDYTGAICVLDGESFLDLYELLPAINSQLEFCGAVVINKADLIDEKRLEEIMDIVNEINPTAAAYITSYCRIDARELVENLTQSPAKARQTSNTYESRPLTFIIKGTEEIPLDRLEMFLEDICGDAYRIKGFANTDKGPKEVSAVGKNVYINNWNKAIPSSEIVVISSIGFKMMSRLTASIKMNLDGIVSL